jgi:hypothetical protein
LITVENIAVCPSGFYQIAPHCSDRPIPCQTKKTYENRDVPPMVVFLFPVHAQKLKPCRIHILITPNQDKSYGCPQKKDVAPRACVICVLDGTLNCGEHGKFRMHSGLEYTY